MQEFITHFGIDGKLLFAQLVNFTVLLIVLKKFAFAPITAMLRRRREDIEEGVKMHSEAQENLKKSAEERERAHQQGKIDAFEIVNQAQARAEERKDEILALATKKSEEVIANAKRLIRQEKARMTQEFARDAEELVQMSITRVLGNMKPDQRDKELIHEAMQVLKSTDR